MIELRNVTYSYPNRAEAVLQNVSLQIQPGEFLLVVGPSGAGKSTLLRCFNGLVPHFYGGHFSGSIDVLGKNPLVETPRGMSGLVGFVFQDPEAQFVAGMVEDELAFALENHHFPEAAMRKRLEEVLDQLSIASLRKRKVSQLSGGEKQRVAIGSVLALNPRVLVLDEPTSQLDPQAAEEVLTTLQKINQDLGITIILSEHRLERVVEYIDRICFMPGEGQPIIIGPPRDVLMEIPFGPPLAELGKRLHWQPLPITLKEARSQLQDWRPAPRPITEKARSTETLMSVRKLHFAYNGKEVLHNVSLELRKGELCALMGRNGSGKTTLLKNMVGLLHPQKGEIILLGQNVTTGKLEDRTKDVGFIPQNPDRLLFAETVEEELTYSRQGSELPVLAGATLLDYLGLASHLEDYPRDLSVGERQRLALATILQPEPAVLLLDEPTRGLDYDAKYKLHQLILDLKKKGCAVLMATHDVELTAHVADRVTIMGEGEIIVDGPAREVLNESMVFSPQINKLFHQPQYLTVEDVFADEHS